MSLVDAKVGQYPVGIAELDKCVFIIDKSFICLVINKYFSS